MTKDEALDLALEALEGIHPGNMTPMAEEYWNKAITAIKQARSAPVQEPVGDDEIAAWAERHDIQGSLTDLRSMFEDAASLTTPPAAQPAPVQEPVQEVRLWDTQWTNVVNHDNAYRGWDKQDAINHAVKMTEHYIAKNVLENKCPPAQPAPVAFEVGLVEWVGNKLMATPKVTTTPPASWMEMVTANLVREGVGKHKARELAEHFYGLAQPAPTAQEPVAWMQSDEVHISLWKDDYHTIPLYTTPPAAQRQWVGVTLTDREKLRDRYGWNYPALLVDAVSDILEEKNNG
jgi:hypothetical protein